MNEYVEVMGVHLTGEEYMAFNYHACYVLGRECWNALKPEEKLEIVKRFKEAEA
jgi:hypothetical protein